MSDHHRKNEIIMISILALVLIATAQNSIAIGVGPGISELPFTPGMERTVKLKIGNDERKNLDIMVTADGELAKYITINQPEFSFSASDEYKIITYKVSLPDDIGEPGPHEARILVYADESENGLSGTQITPKVVMYSILRVNVAYPGKYAKIRLIAPNFRVGKKSSFGIEINNLGTENIYADSIVTVKTPLEATVAALKGEKTAIQSKNTELITIPYTPENAGRFMAISNVEYDADKVATDEKEFSVGEPYIKVLNITSEQFRLGQISKFDIIFESQWNEPINDVHAIVTIEDDRGNLYSEYTTKDVDVDPLSTKSVSAYLETDKLDVGDFIMKINLNYLGKEDEKEFDISVFKDRVRLAPTGQAVSTKLKAKTGVEQIQDWVAIMMMIIIAIVIANISIIKKLRSGGGGSYLKNNSE